MTPIILSLEVAWQNPHVHFIVRAADPSGKMQTWDIEANSLSILRRTDATLENLKVATRSKSLARHRAVRQTGCGQ